VAIGTDVWSALVIARASVPPHSCNERKML
jgi:hypothetical protein